MSKWIIDGNISTPVLLPGKSHGWRSLVGCSPWGHEESDVTERLHFHFSLSCIGEGNGNPLQCSCLENPRDGRAWWAAISGVAQSRIRLKRLSSSSSNISYARSHPHVCWMWTLMRRNWLGELWNVSSLETQSAYIQMDSRIPIIPWVPPFPSTMKNWIHLTIYEAFIHTFVQVIHLPVRKKLWFLLPPLSIPLQNEINFQQQNYKNYKGEGKVPALVLDAVCTVYWGPEKLTRIQLKNLPLPVSWV